MKLIVYKDGKEVFSGSPIDDDGAFPKEIPGPVRDYLVDSWAYWKVHYRGNFEAFWGDYISRRMPANMGLALLGYSMKIGV